MAEHEEKALILIVEDDIDLMSFLVDELGEEYEVLSAVNGQAGLDKAYERLPDLVITDLMMPVMDGVELCKELKRNQKTSHIPVIMLTAKDSVESQLEGLKTGADDYITKPFVLKLLEVGVKNLLDSRRLLREQFRREFLEEGKAVAANLPDQDFMSRSLKVLEEKAADPDFSAEILAEKMGMSLSTLHRKLKSLTGETPAKLIWHVRLKRAAKLLKTSDLQVTEIAFMVGYTDSNHFGRQFKQYFGVTPSQFRSDDS